MAGKMKTSFFASMPDNNSIESLRAETLGSAWGQAKLLFYLRLPLMFLSDLALKVEPFPTLEKKTSNSMHRTMKSA